MDDLSRLTRKRFNQKKLLPAQNRQSISQSASESSSSTPGTGAGIASPLTEEDNTRTYHTMTEIVSSDGFFVMEIMHIKSADFTDDNGEPVHIDYDNPDT